MRRAPTRPSRQEATVARRWLALLTHSASDAGIPSATPGAPATFAMWLNGQQLGPLAHHTLPPDSPLAAALRGHALGVAASSLAHAEILGRVEADFEEAGIPLVLLKGAALAGPVWGDPALRPMSDIDAWVRAEDLPRATARMGAMGFVEVNLNRRRPQALKLLGRGESQFRLPGRESALVELHVSPFKGFWARHTATVDESGIHERSLPAGPGRHARVLAPEDQVIHLAFHLATGQFSAAPLRAIVDIALVARAASVDWTTVADRAAAWRLATMTWTVLDRAEHLVGVRGAAEATSRLRPFGPRRAILRRLVPRDEALWVSDGRRPRMRPLLLLLMVDRFRDMGRILLRSVWPERAWVAARYGRRNGRVRHLWRLVRHGDT